MTVTLKEEHPLKWPEGWEHTPLGNRKSQNAWKKTLRQYKEALEKEFSKVGVTDVLLTYNPSPSDRMDPGVAVYFAKRVKEDYTWQTVLGLNTPAPTLDAPPGSQLPSGARWL